MKNEMKTQLVAIEESSLETVAGGYRRRPLLDLDIDVLKQKNEVIFAGNAIAAGGDFTFVVEQSND